MSDEGRTAERSFLRRWSQRKLAAAREEEAAAVAPVASDRASPQAVAEPAVVEPAATRPAEPPAVEPELPPVESLTFESDFTAFLKPSVDPTLRRAALRRLFSDPRFNVMDGLDVYIDDYNRFEPIPPEILKQLAHARYLFDPPKTRVNALGHVEDVPEQEIEAVAAADAGQADAAPEAARLEAVDNAECAPPIVATRDADSLIPAGEDAGRAVDPEPAAKHDA